MSASIKHTEDVWRNYPLRVDVTRGVTLNDALTEVTERRLIDIAIKHGDENIIRLSWADAQKLRDALTAAIDATADLGDPA